MLKKTNIANTYGGKKMKKAKTTAKKAAKKAVKKAK